MRKPYLVRFGPAVCAVDLCDGSERGEYVNQDYILTRLGRPHRAINLMYCYYPNDEGWPLRASVAHAHDAQFAWDYPYDDYFPYTGGLGGSHDGPVFEQMRESIKDSSILVISHQERILQIADEIIVVAECRIREHGPREQVLPHLIGTAEAVAACDRIQGGAN